MVPLRPRTSSLDIPDLSSPRRRREEGGDGGGGSEFVGSAAEAGGVTVVLPWTGSPRGSAAGVPRSPATPAVPRPSWEDVVEDLVETEGESDSESDDSEATSGGVWAMPAGSSLGVGAKGASDDGYTSDGL